MSAVLDARRDTDIMPFSYGSRSIKGMLIIERWLPSGKAKYSEAAIKEAQSQSPAECWRSAAAFKDEQHQTRS